MSIADPTLFDEPEPVVAEASPTSSTTRRAGTPRRDSSAAATRRASTRDANAPLSWHEKVFGRRRSRTGSGATTSADNIVMHWLANFALVLGVVAGGVGSIDGLLHAAGVAFTETLRPVLPVAVDVFLVGTAIATLALRARRAWVPMVFCIVVTLGLVGFSAAVNFVYWQSVTEPGTLAHEVGPYIKGSMPVLLLVALEILAAINTTKRKTVPGSVLKLRAEHDRLKAEGSLKAKIAKLRIKAKAKIAKASGESKAPTE